MPDFPRFDLSNQVALVTGAGKGLGRAAALALADAGADVALGLRDATTGGEVVEAVRALGRTAFPLQMDISDLAQVAAAVDQTLTRFGRIDILVNNAGIAPENPAERVTERDFDQTCAVNLKGTFFVSQAVGRIMIGQRRGRIINLSSQAGFVALPGESVYCMTKAAIAHLTKCLAVEWGHARHHGQRGGARRSSPRRERSPPSRTPPSRPMSSSASRRCIVSASRWTSPARSCFSLLPRRR